MRFVFRIATACLSTKLYSCVPQGSGFSTWRNCVCSSPDINRRIKSRKVTQSGLVAQVSTCKAEGQSTA